MAELLMSLVVAGLLWAAIVPLLSYRVTDGRGLLRHERLQLALAISGKTLLWLGVVGAIAGWALMAGGMEALVVVLMGLMFLVFGVVAVVRARTGSAARTRLAQPNQLRR